MKLRLRNNSVRLRLTQGEVERFRESGIVEESIEFGPGAHQRLTYALATTADGQSVHATISANRVIVYVPASDGREWAGSDRVGMQGRQAIGRGTELHILVEKDFTCLEPRADGDDIDTFPHPSQCGAEKA
jgi:hypothetical protein